MVFSNTKKYLSAFFIGFVICWFLFYTNFSYAYELLVNKLTYKGLTYITLFLSYYIFCVVFYDLFSSFTSNQKQKRIMLFVKWIVITILCLTTYCICDDKISDWRYFLIHILNLLLYVFAWYSLLKAFKVWRNYGQFYNLFLQGKILMIVFSLFVILLSINVFYFNINNQYFENSFGLFAISLCLLFFISLVLSILFYYCKPLRNKIIEFKNITEERRRSFDKPKEVSIVYDQLTLITLLSVISKRVFDTEKAVDFPFIFSKIFKIFCYSVSLLTTCLYSKQLKKVLLTLIFIMIISILLLFCSHNTDVREIIANDDLNRNINLIIDYIFLPLGTIKVLIQILTIIVAKRATSISTDYFKIAAFFSIITALNLISKERFGDNTITMSFFKCFLYLMVIFVVNLFNRINSKNKEL